MKSAQDRDGKPVRQDHSVRDNPVHDDIVRHDLDGCYGRIGMPALAAALRYPGERKNSEYAPVENNGAAREYEQEAA